LAERKRRGEDAVDDRLDEVDGDDVSVDDDLADDELSSDLDDLADDDDEPAGRGAATVRKRTRLTKATADDADDDDDEDEDDDEDDEDAKGKAKSDGRRPKGRGSKPGDKRPVKKAGDKPNVFARFANFVREVVAELRKVIWPTRKELLTYTAVVVVFVTIMFTIVAGLDWVFTKGVVTIFGHGTTK